MKKLRNIFCRLLLALLFLLAFSVTASTEAASMGTGENLPETVTMSREQFQVLRLRITTLESLLTQLQQELALQKNTSSELIPLVVKLQSELKASTLELDEAKTSLNDANQKLVLANQYLQTLSAQIKKERQQVKAAQIRSVVYTALIALAADRAYLHFT